RARGGDARSARPYRTRDPPPACPGAGGRAPAGRGTAARARRGSARTVRDPRSRASCGTHFLSAAPIEYKRRRRCDRARSVPSCSRNAARKRLHLFWQFTTNGPIYGSPSVSGSRVLIGDSSGTLWVLHTDTGAVLDQLALGNWDPVPPGYVGGGIWQAPAIDAARNLVLFSTGNPPNGNSACGEPIPPNTAGDHTDSIVALDATTGSEVWTYQAIPGDVADLDFGGSGPTLLTAGGRDLVATGSKNGKLYCLDRSTGQVVWIRDLGPGLFSPPGNAHGRLFLDLLNNLSVALDGATGS